MQFHMFGHSCSVSDREEKIKLGKKIVEWNKSHTGRQAGRQVNEQYVQALLKKAVVQKNPKYKKQKAQKVNFSSAPIWLNSSLQQSNS